MFKCIHAWPAIVASSIGMAPDHFSTLWPQQERQDQQTTRLPQHHARCLPLIFACCLRVSLCVCMLLPTYSLCEHITQLVHVGEAVGEGVAGVLGLTDSQFQYVIDSMEHEVSWHANAAADACIAVDSGSYSKV